MKRVLCWLLGHDADYDAKWEVAYGHPVVRTRVFCKRCGYRERERTETL